MRQEKARSPFVSSQSLVNCVAEQAPDSGWAIYGGPGLDEFSEVGDGPIRGVHDYNGGLLAVSGGVLYSVDTNGTETEIGAVAGYDPVIMANNGSQVAIVSDSTSYVYDGTDMDAINDTDFRTASSVDFLKQVLIFTEKNSGRFFTSELADATSYSALDVATAEAKPDKLRRVLVSGNEALLFGEKSVEGYYFSGKPNGVPLSPTQTYLDYGLAGRDAVCAIDNTIAWLSHLLDIRTLRDQSPIAIADPTITAMIQGWTNPENAKAFSFAAGGHEYMALRHAQGCALWDATTQLWSMRQSQNMSTWRVDSSVWCYNKNIMGDATEGKLWTLNPNTHKEGTNALIRTIVSRTLGPGGAPFTLENVELEIEVGVGLASGQGSAPIVWMQLSRDGGETWGARMERSLGAMGNRNLRVMWAGLSADFLPHGGVIRFGCSDPVRFVATKAFAEITVNQ
jgi:hypothetical protein